MPKRCFRSKGPADVRTQTVPAAADRAATKRCRELPIEVGRRQVRQAQADHFLGPVAGWLVLGRRRLPSGQNGWFTDHCPTPLTLTGAGEGLRSRS